MGINIISTLKTFIEKHALFPKGKCVVVGFSGGPDSRFLLHFLSQQLDRKIPLVVAHFDHQWRAESGKDRVFCQSVAQSYELPFVFASAEQYFKTVPYNGSKEAHARLMRRHFFAKVKQEHNAEFVALGHHADDQQETFFIRLIRGASLSGLCAMRIKTADGYVRPLLCLYKKEIVSYLTRHGIAYLVDRTNESDDFLRNRIRAKVIPQLRGTDNRFDDNFSKTVSHLQKADAFLSRIAFDYYQEMVQRKKGRPFIHIKTFCALADIIRKHVLVIWLSEHNVPFSPSYAFFKEIERFCLTPAKRHAIKLSWSLVKEKGYLGIQKEKGDSV